MERYEVIVIETIAQKRLYIVEAYSQNEADEKAISGDTLEEITLNTIGVVNRDIE